MSKNNKKTDWSEDRWKTLLVEQRKYLWREDSLDMIAAWLSLTSGMTAVDVGCGLGYLGYTYWPYFGEGGRYIGVDISFKLLKDTMQAAHQWASGGRADFITGDATGLPLYDDLADLVMCQVLMIHLEEPEEALNEMIRVTKPGGIILCLEPDNLSASLVRPYNSVPDLSIEEQLLSIKIDLLSYRGRIKLGRGDWHTGARIPWMMQQSGLIDIDARIKDSVYFILPPYESPQQKHRIEMMKNNFLNDKNQQFWLERQREEFLAGGGSDEEYDRGMELYHRIRPLVQQQVENGQYHSCVHHPLYIVRGRKPY